MPLALRRAFRNDRMRALFDEASDAEWDSHIDGAGHVRMTSPDGKSVMVLSITSNTKGRSYLNCRAVFRRWQRSQQEEPTVANPTIEAAIEEVEDREMYKAVTGEEAPRALPPAEEETALDPDPLDLQRPLCACGCGKPVSEDGKYLRGHHMRSTEQREASRVNGSLGGQAKAKTKKAAPNHGQHDNASFTIEEVITVAQFAGEGGLVEIARLKQGLELALSFRGVSKETA